MGLATDIASSVGSALPMARMAEMIYAKAIETNPELAGKDFSSIYNYLKELEQ
jgi:3-hydroxyisobutyrate dehydrogenase